MSAGDYEIDKAKLDALIAKVSELGVVVEQNLVEPEGARFVGTFTGHLLTLYPKYDSNFALYFTVAHLYGHMVQIVRDSERTKRANAILSVVLDPKIYKNKRAFTVSEVQMIYDHELEAAAIGRTVMADMGKVDAELDIQYARIFLADFHYLIHVLETGEAGPDSFARFLRREPKPWNPIPPDPQPLVKVGHLKPETSTTVTVV
ncbi:MAG: hypothetical protein ACAI38_12615 [Myxococcota bacterium]|nr:hypothetical protein [Myxococcota bacterium]